MTASHDRPRRRALRPAAVAILASLAILSGAPPAGAGAGPQEGAGADRGMAILSASVAGDGSRVRDAGITAAERVSLGTFRVTFARSVADCTCTASGGANDLTSAIYGVNAAANCPYYGNNAARISTTNSGGMLVDAPFHLLVFCPK